MAPNKIVLRFPASIADKPIIFHLVKDYDLMINILKAHINPHKEGTMVLEVEGVRAEDGLAFLRDQGVGVQPLTEEIVWNEERCTHCGACTAICPTRALYVERPAMLVHFDSEACVVCQLCVRACPMRAMEVRF
ncbi:MAG: 4Fe-4S dicluster domain-containing protein [Ammonifex sp.]|jgi:ferredoxin|nr:MAG: 4Fe-4S dicluster domain-containing protein [Ammonifex sp.]